MIELYNDDCINLMQTLPDESIDVVCIDPPYLYLKGQKLERPFDERLFFTECKRLLTKNGFIVMFGRGTSFYRWNTILDELGFTFKEEIIWDKSHCTSPLMSVSRVHETVSIWAKKNGVVNKCKIPYLEIKGHDLGGIVQDVKRMKSILKNTKSLDAVLNYLESSGHNYQKSESITKYSATTSADSMGDTDRAAKVISSMKAGMNEKSIIKYRDTSDSWGANNISISSMISKENRSVSVARSMDQGMNEKTIIKQVRDHYSAIHPTQKPVRLIERLLALVIPKTKPIDQVVVADFFGGSFSTMEAVNNIGCKGIACEIDEEYFNAGKKRIEGLPKKVKDLFSECG
ncbi:DNA-methyltransferase [Niabella sp. 22666]|uniref:DNA-methyltransferase n=1 Tax=Niabella sp. 22666 TaxID=3453954 RepID=UPI003F82E5EE